MGGSRCVWARVRGGGGQKCSIFWDLVRVKQRSLWQVWIVHFSPCLASCTENGVPFFFFFSLSLFSLLLLCFFSLELVFLFPFLFFFSGRPNKVPFDHTPPRLFVVRDVVSA
jgi:hypothetical protein